MGASRALVCVPTYNERDNVEALVRALGEVIDTTRDGVLVIDDGSPDGTGEIADRLAAELSWLDVLHRTRKEGIGKAYLAGFERALETDAELVLEMDCDFSHDPQDVPRLIAMCEEGGADLALGSRWVAGGGTENWGLVRRVISRGGSLYARIVLGVGIRDLTGGFKCFRRTVLETIDLDAIAARGYGFQIEGTYRALRAGFGVVEIPIVFVDRRVGESKMSGAIVLEAMRQVPVLRWRALRGNLVVLDVTDATFAAVVLESDVPVLVEFTAPWCRPCKAIEPLLSEIGSEHGGRLRLARLDIDVNLGVPARYGVLSLPTVMVFVAGEPVEVVHGAQPRRRYADAVARALAA